MSQSYGADTASSTSIFATIAKQKLKEKIMLRNITISALALAVAMFSVPVHASVNQTTFDNNLAKKNLNIAALDIDYGLSKNTGRSPDLAPVVVAWSFKGAAKKVGNGVKKVAKGAKKTAKIVKRKARNAGKGVKRFGSVSKKLFVGTGRQAGQALRAANRVIVPSEIRNGASKVYRTAKRGVKHVIKHPYGKRCKPNKYLQPVCSVYPTKRRINTHDHRR